MRPRYFGWLALATALLSAGAQAQTRQTQGFERDCADAVLANGSSLSGYFNYPSTLFQSCGIASITSSESPTQLRIARPNFLLSIPGVSDLNALVGAGNDHVSSDLTLRFDPPVNELAFQVLGISQPMLRIATFSANDSLLSDEAGAAATNETVSYARNSSTAIARVVITYSQVPPGLFGAVDSWFVDQLTFNAWVCGDGEVDNTGGGTETCDDANRVQCDGCSSACTASIVGCFDGTQCVAPGGGTACTSCDMSQAPGASGDIPLSPKPTGTSCDDGLKCTQGDACDGAGRCTGTARGCDDSLTCTSDTCSEAAAGDGCVHALGARDCLIGTSCVADMTPNPQNPCQLCDPTRSQSAWSPQDTTTRCGSPSCVGGQFTAAATCDGAGACAPATPVSCGNFACATSLSCTESCSNDGECGPASHCDTASGKCVDNLQAGAPCSASNECAAGLSCADGVCCDSVCGSKCETCVARGFVGKCVNITFGDPDDECPDGSSCRSGNQCVADPLPEPPPPPPPPPPMTMPMEPSVQPPLLGVLPIGAACDRNELCSTGACRDNVCCDSACDGPCRGCNVLGAPPGQCTPYSLGSDPKNECAGVGGVCNGESACTSFGTRGNGLCAAAPISAQDDARGRYALWGLGAAFATLVWRRTRRPKRAQRS